MAFLVQDDAGTVDSANAYISVAEFDTYHGDRGNDVSAFSTTDKEQAIVRATDYMDQRFRWVGERGRVDQRTGWPRIDAEDRDRDVRFGIPREVKDACAEYARIAATTPVTDLNPTPDRDDTGRAIQKKSERTDVLEESVEYSSGAAFELPKYPKADLWLFTSGLAISARTRDLRRA